MYQLMYNNKRYEIVKAQSEQQLKTVHYEEYGTMIEHDELRFARQEFLNSF